jgi:hypothetical protein
MEGFGERFGLNNRLIQNNRVIIPYLLEIFEQFKLFLELEIQYMVLVLGYSFWLGNLVDRARISNGS